MSARARDTDLVDEDAAAAEEEGLDLEAVKEALGFVSRAPRRHPWLAASVFVAVGALGLAVAQAVPLTYTVQVKIVAQRNLPFHALGDPNSAVARDQDNPTHNVADLILQRDNLIALIREADVVKRFYANRRPVARFKDALLEHLRGPISDEDKLLNVLGMLQKRLQVWSDDNSGTVTINVDWNEPRMAYELASLVQHNFLEARYDSETKMVEDTINVLEGHAKTEAEQVDTALAEYETAKMFRAQAGPASEPPSPRTAVPPAASPPPAATIAAAAPAPAPDPDLTKALEDTRRRIRQLEDEQQRDIDSVKSQLAQAELTLTPMHPTVVQLRQRLEQLRRSPPELDELKTRERSLMSQIAPAPVTTSVPGASQAWARPVVPPPTSPAAGPLGADDPDRLARDPALAPVRGRLDAAIHRYQDVMSRIDGAKLDLDITRTAFQYRYSVVSPAEFPRGPRKPISTWVTLAAAPLAVLVALLAAAAADLLSGRLIETWQVRRRLKLAVLGELEPPV